MYRHLLLIMLVDLLFLHTCAQHTSQNGIVTFQNSNNKPAVGAQVKALWSTPTLSDARGNFNLVFIEKSSGSEVELTIELNGYEVVNKTETIFNLNPEKKVKFYLCKAGQWEENALNFYKINKQAIVAKYNRKIDQLLKRNINALDSISILQKERDKALQSANELSELFAKVNLDDAGDLLTKAYTYFKKGQIDSAINFLSINKIDDKIKNAFKQRSEGQLLISVGNDKVQSADNAIENYIKLCISAGKLCVAAYQFKHAKEYYELAIRYDSTRLGFIRSYAEYLYESNDSDYAKFANLYLIQAAKRFSELSQLLHFSDSSFAKITILAADMSKVYDMIGDVPDAKKIYLKAIELFNKIDTPSFAKYEDIAMLCFNFASINFKNEDFYGRTLDWAKHDSLHSESRRYLLAATKIIDSLYLIDSTRILPFKISLLRIRSYYNLFSGGRKKAIEQAEEYIRLNQTVKSASRKKRLADFLTDATSLASLYSRDSSSKSVTLVRQMVDSAKVLYLIDSSYLPAYLHAINTLAKAYGDKHDSVAFFTHQTINVYRNLAGRDPSYLTNLFKIYSDLTYYYSEIEEVDSAIFYSHHTCNILDTLCFYARDRFQVEYAKHLGILAQLIVKKKNFSQALRTFDKSIEQYKQVLNGIDTTAYTYRDFGIVLNNAAAVSDSMKNFEKEIQYYNTALTYYLNSYKYNPHLWKEGLVYEYGMIGQAYFYWQLNQPDTSLQKSYLRKVEEYEIQAFRLDTNAQYLFQCGIAYYNLAGLEDVDSIKLNDLKRGTDYFLAGIKIKPARADLFSLVNPRLTSLINLLFKSCQWQLVVDYSRMSPTLLDNLPMQKRLISELLITGKLKDATDNANKQTDEFRTQLKSILVETAAKGCIGDIQKDLLISLGNSIN